MVLLLWSLLSTVRYTDEASKGSYDIYHNKGKYSDSDNNTNVGVGKLFVAFLLAVATLDILS